MTTKDIEDVFHIRNFTPSRYLNTDFEILEYMKACYALAKGFGAMWEDAEDDENDI